MPGVEQDAYTPGVSLDTGHTLATLRFLALWASREVHKDEFTWNSHRVGHDVPEPLWWHSQHLHPSDFGSDAETRLAFQTRVLPLYCYGVTGISVWVRFCKRGQDRTALSEQHPPNSKVITRREYGTSQPRLKMPEPYKCITGLYPRNVSAALF